MRKISDEHILEISQLLAKALSLPVDDIQSVFTMNLDEVEQEERNDEA